MTVIGFALNLVGLLISTVSVVSNWREHTESALLPRVRISFRRRSSTVHQASASLTAEIRGSASAKLDTAADASSSLEDRLNRIDERVGSMQDVLGQHDYRLRALASESKAAAEAVHTHLRAGLAEQQALTTRVAIGSTRRDLASIFCVALGTVLMSVPSLLGLPS